MIDSKATYIYSLVRMKELTKGNAGKKGVIFVTSIGQIQGELLDIEDVDVSSADSINSRISELESENKELDLFSVADAYCEKQVNSLREKYDIANQISENHAIPLKNVKIKTLNGQYSEVNYMVLFADQIIGIMPGTFPEE